MKTLNTHQNNSNQTDLTNLQRYRQFPSAVSLEGVDVLVGLGLSGRQARVYLASLKLPEAPANPNTVMARSIKHMYFL
ncbi:MAG: hypothetical protein M1540_06590 [Candidatus Bathyarchaeota archaeon]|nr:hypothetical protein [Candidatus Bathyarchaeota archaeon]